MIRKLISKIRIVNHFRDYGMQYGALGFIIGMIGAEVGAINLYNSSKNACIDNIIHKVESHDTRPGISATDRDYFLSIFKDKTNGFFDMQKARAYFEPLKYLCAKDTIPKICLKNSLDVIESYDFLKYIENGLK